MSEIEEAISLLHQARDIIRRHTIENSSAKEENYFFLSDSEGFLMDRMGIKPRY